MKLKIVNIHFQSLDDFFEEVELEISGKKKPRKNSPYEYVMESRDSFKGMITPNRLHVLIGISRFRPQSVYQLAKKLGRAPHHVLGDCRFLEGMNFINLREGEGERKQLIPELAFEFDVIQVCSELGETYPISERASQALLALA